MQAFSNLPDTLNAALAAYRSAIEQTILAKYQRRKAVLAFDMIGLMLTVRRDGIL